MNDSALRQLDALLAANARFAESFADADLEAPPTRGIAIVTCMDARIDPVAALGLQPGDAHVIRNAGGSAREALRSLVVSQAMLGTRAIALIKHTRCGMQGLSADEVASQLGLASDPREALPDLHAFSELEQAVRDDLELLRGSPVLRTDALRGFVYEVETGLLRQIEG